MQETEAKNHAKRKTRSTFGGGDLIVGNDGDDEVIGVIDTEEAAAAALCGEFETDFLTGARIIIEIFLQSQLKCSKIEFSQRNHSG